MMSSVPDITPMWMPSVSRAALDVADVALQRDQEPLP